MEAILQPIVHSHLFVNYVNELNKYYKTEKQRRQKFYEDVKEETKAEFINGEIIMHSPVKVKHSLASDFLYNILSIYSNSHSLGKVFHEKIMISLTRNDFEPDICFFSKEKFKNLKVDQWQLPAPDFIVEILSDSTEKIDRGVKFDDYAEHGVKEYWLVDPDEKTVEQYILKNKKYELLFKASDGNIECKTIKGLKFPVRAIFDEKINLKVIRDILNKKS
ncbi:MAG: hypothetical protein HW421_155 [Ignavibacteria bacterium]|nr:hypothetical protein [Ignavibacteria bacterium]